MSSCASTAPLWSLLLPLFWSPASVPLARLQPSSVKVGFPLRLRRYLPGRVK